MKSKIDLKDNEVKFDLSGNLSIYETKCKNNDKKHLENLVKKQLEENINSLIKESKMANSDILGIKRLAIKKG